MISLLTKKGGDEMPLIDMEMFRLHIKAIELGRTHAIHKEVIKHIFNKSFGRSRKTMFEIASKAGVSLHEH